MAPTNEFVPNGWYAFESTKSGDYHDNMNSTVFEDWLKSILPSLDKNSVIVLDNMPYHLRHLVKNPTTASKKQDIIDWLIAQGIEADMSELKVELLMKVKQANVKPVYIVDEIICSTG